MRVVAKGFNEYGDPIVIEGSDLLARCVQHETDHLDGVLFIDRLAVDQRKLAMRAVRDSEWSGDLVRRHGQGLAARHTRSGAVIDLAHLVRRHSGGCVTRTRYADRLTARACSP